MALEESSATWKIVIGHHTIFSAGHHGNTQELVDQLLPILEVHILLHIKYIFWIIHYIDDEKVNFI